jgi:hypothetical protein
MTPFEELVKAATLHLTTSVEAIGAAVIAFAVATTVRRRLCTLVTRLALVSLGTRLSFALEFEVAALRSVLNLVLRSASDHLVRTLTVATSRNA